MKNILIVDSDPIMLHTLCGLFRSYFSFLRILSASSVPSAVGVFKGNDIHLMITGMHMSEADTFQLVSSMAAYDPKLKIIVIAYDVSNEFFTKLRQIPSVVHFNHAMEISALTKRICTELQIDFGAQIRGITLVSVLQMIELEERSCTLRVSAKGKTGKIFIVRGKPAAAKMELLTGNQAMLDILTWQNVLIDIDFHIIDVPQEINASLMNLILKSGQQIDEKRSQRLNMRKYRRYDCLVGVEFSINDWYFQCHMCDISEGGAYIETEHPLKVGQRLVLSLSSPAIERSCTIHGTVVRRDTKGIGLRFDELSLTQKQVIRSLIESHCVPIPETPQRAVQR